MSCTKRHDSLTFQSYSKGMVHPEKVATDNKNWCSSITV